MGLLAPPIYDACSEG